MLSTVVDVNIWCWILINRLISYITASRLVDWISTSILDLFNCWIAHSVALNELILMIYSWLNKSNIGVNIQSTDLLAVI